MGQNTKMRELRKAYSWMAQPGIKAMLPCDKDSKHSMECIFSFVAEQIKKDDSKDLSDDYLQGAKDAFKWLLEIQKVNQILLLDTEYEDNPLDSEGLLELFSKNLEEKSA